MHLNGSDTQTKMIAVMGAILCSSFIAWSLELPAENFSKLKSQGFREREFAESELLAWGRLQPEPAMLELFRQSRIADDPEVRKRCLQILRDLVADEYLKAGEGYIGIDLGDEISFVPGDPKPRSVIRVTEVWVDTPGHYAGIHLNDLIVGLDGQVWREMDASARFREMIRMMRPQNIVEIKILRDGGLIDLQVKLGRRPLIADNPFFNGQKVDPDASERAAKEAYFRRWLCQKKLQK